MRVETCSFCSAPVYPSKGIQFVRNDAKVFRFCKSKCHKNYKMRRNPRKLGWTKAYRAAHGKEMTVDTTLTFAARRNVPTRYNRDLVATTIKAMGRVSEIRARRERVFYKKRMAGKKARVLEEDRKLVKEQGHLLPPELQEKKNSMELEESTIMDMEDTMEETTKVEGQKRERKTRRKMLVGGGVVDEEMDLD